MDLVSSQYGWPDEYILGLAYVRFSQIQDVILERKKQDIERWHGYAQLFYPWIIGLATGKLGELPDLFSDVTDKSPNAQYRTDLWWEKPSIN